MAEITIDKLGELDNKFKEFYVEKYGGYNENLDEVYINALKKMEKDELISELNEINKMKEESRRLLNEHYKYTGFDESGIHPTLMNIDYTIGLIDQELKKRKTLPH